MTKYQSIINVLFSRLLHWVSQCFIIDWSLQISREYLNYLDSFPLTCYLARKGFPIISKQALKIHCLVRTWLNLVRNIFFFLFINWPYDKVKKKEKLPKAFTSPTKTLLRRKIPLALLWIHLGLLPCWSALKGNP